MPRPRTVSDDDVLDGVLALAHRVGPAKLTLAAAAREVGLSPATLIQRYGTKHELLLAADRRGVERWVTPVEEAEHPSPLDRVVEGLVGAVDPDMTPEAMANSVAMLQLDLVEPDFHAATLSGARRLRAALERHLQAAADAGELREGIEIAALAKLVETAYHGSMIGWALHREGSLPAWMRQQIEAVLAPLRT
ncbi:TetR/AcrR family transcriptional regulator [Glycomyces albidus]|jgi:AcrR family transcriptional regulator|uniref:TetR family transcriptional regulator n=1 Tax=Glycomyces albidus TaxID=2656774 RepID=A0A6L5G544_9ACTN|nr:TetR family transcriptional regulator [Glycomyces albidus]MQM24752.1 TetR family transcriptional regulator [Glycomyces albidus]